jgi:hypothetical protein
MPTGIGGEVGWWCPSLDDSGNGTTTLNDLVSTKPGTLTNFALTGSTSNWVADTDFGGVRAIDSDGTNDTVRFSQFPALGTGDYTISVWAKVASKAFKCVCGSLNAGPWYLATHEDATSGKLQFYDGAYFRSTAVWADGTWHHLAVRRSGGNITLWIDGIQSSSPAASTANMTNVQTRLCGITLSDSFNIAGRVDDFRVFGLGVSDANLVKLASKRGYQPSSFSDDGGMFGGMSGSMTGGMAS